MAPSAATERLATYRAKRDFAVTSEPSGSGPAPEPGNRFVVQRHRARRLHYDLRLEMGGVLVSWAVPKGPTLDPARRGLAVHVEDHPLDYFDFEGVIPGHEYGAGDVIVWDWGTWTPAGRSADDPEGAVREGDLHFDLHGQKLAGRFVLVRRDNGTRGKEGWILLHKNDEHAVPGWDPEDHPESVKSGRTNDQVKSAPARTWTRATGGSATTPTWDAPTTAELEELEGLRREGRWTVGGQTLKVTNLDKVLFPAAEGGEPVTKRDFIRYHVAVSPWMLPYLHDRAVNFHRYPSGIDRPGFWAKEVPGHAPEWLTRWHHEDADPDETQWYAVLDSPAALAWAANQAAIEVNPWTSRLGDAHRPTWALVDIDPGPATDFDDVITLTRLYRTALEHLSLEARPKVTGKRGIQIWIPVEPTYTFDETRAWVEKLSRMIGRLVPELISWEWQKSRRGGLIRLDYTQNAINKTLVAPFSARPAPGAPVSVPLQWEEVDDPDLRPDRWDVRTVLDRLRVRGDPLAPLIGTAQRLPSL